MQETYALLQEALGPIDVVAVGSALQEVRRVPMADATRTARHCYGIVEENLPENQAQALEIRLRDLGVPVFIVPTSDLCAYPKPQVVHNADLKEDGLYAETSSGVFDCADWEQVRLVSFGKLQSEESVLVRRKEPEAARALRSLAISTTGIPLREAQPATRRRKTVVTETFLVRILSSGPWRSFQFDKEEFNYDTLGKRIQFETTSNLRLFVRSLIERAPHLVLCQNMASFMEGDMRSVMAFPGERDFEEYHQWLYHWVRRQNRD